MFDTTTPYGPLKKRWIDGCYSCADGDGRTFTLSDSGNITSKAIRVPIYERTGQKL